MSNVAWVTETENIFRTASDLCYTITFVIAVNGLTVNLSATHDKMFLISDKSGNRTGESRIKHPVYRGRSGNDVIHVIATSAKYSLCNSRCIAAVIFN